eukprot:1136606-Pelagomonas_calceolata.AAC.3
MTLAGTGKTSGVLHNSKSVEDPSLPLKSGVIILLGFALQETGLPGGFGAWYLYLSNENFTP